MNNDVSNSVIVENLMLIYVFILLFSLVLIGSLLFSLNSHMTFYLSVTDHHMPPKWKGFYSGHRPEESPV